MSEFMTVVIKMPTNPDQRSRIVDALGIGNKFHGGTVTAASSEDEISKIERYEELYNDLPDVKSTLRT